VSNVILGGMVVRTDVPYVVRTLDKPDRSVYLCIGGSLRRHRVR
jgi:hypothetical protein